MAHTLWFMNEYSELKKGQVIHPGLIKDERTGLITIQKGTKYFATSNNGASEQIETIPDSSSYFFHPQSQLIYPIKGNVLYNTDNNRFVVTVDTGVAFSEEKESEFIPFIPYPDNELTINYLTIESQSDLKYANRLVDKETGVAVPILAVTIHPISGVLYPLGGTFISEITNLITPIELGLIHSESNFDNEEKYSYITGINLDSEGKVVPELSQNISSISGLLNENELKIEDDLDYEIKGQNGSYQGYRESILHACIVRLLDNFEKFHEFTTSGTF